MNTYLPTGKPLPFFFKLWQWFAKYYPSLPIGGIMQRVSYNKLTREVIDAYKAPFPTKSHKDGAKAFPQLIPSNPNHPGVDRMKKAKEVLTEWTKPVLVMFSDKDKVMSGLEHFFYKLIPEGDHLKKVTIKNAGHFLQEEKGEEISKYIDQFMKGTLE